MTARTNAIVWETSPYHDACTTMLHCLHCVLWLEFSVCRTSDKLSVALGSKKKCLTKQSTKYYAISFWASQCVLWRFGTASARLFFFNNGTLRGLLAGSLASHRRRLIVTVLTGNLRSSLILLELIIGWAFAILVILRSVRTVVFFLFLLHLSGFGCHFKVFDIILAEQPMIFCTSL